MLLYRETDVWADSAEFAAVHDSQKVEDFEEKKGDGVQVAHLD